MQSAAEKLGDEAQWPPDQGEVISFTTSAGSETATLAEVRRGLVWRDFILQDGRVIPEHRVVGCPQPAVWRKIDEVSDDEREDCEERLLSMAGSGMDPRQRDQSFWAELNQYLAYTYLRYKQAAGRVQDHDEVQHRAPDRLRDKLPKTER